MHQRSSSSLHKFLRRYHISSLTKPNSFSSSKTLPSISPKSVSLFETSIPCIPNSKNCILDQPKSSILNFRSYSGQSEAEFDKNKIVDEINLKFAEAREEIESAMESKETVYFNEEAECARAAVKEVLDMFDGLLSKLDVNERDAIRRSMGLKIEQLKAEIQQLDE